MNRWWGSAADSDKQSSDRSSRYAQRTLRAQAANQAALTIASDEEFADAETSFNAGLNLDGDDDTPVMVDAAQAAAAAAAELNRQKRLPVSEATGPKK